MQQPIDNPLNYFMEKTMKRTNKSAVTAAERLMMVLAVAGLCFMAWDVANATGGSDRCDDGSCNEVEVHVDQDTDVDVDATGGAAYAEAEGGYAMSGSTNEGNDNSNTINTENNSSNIVLVPNNNTENCLRVFGIAFGQDGSAGSLGIPWRSRSCDLESAADDAFAAGEREWGWYWKCQNKNLARSFRLDGMSWDEARFECHKRAVGYATAVQTIMDLKSHIESLEAELAQNNARMNTVAEECRESAERAHATCVDEK